MRKKRQDKKMQLQSKEDVRQHPDTRCRQSTRKKDETSSVGLFGHIFFFVVVAKIETEMCSPFVCLFVFFCVVVSLTLSNGEEVRF